MATRYLLAFGLTMGMLAAVPGCSSDGDVDTPSEVKSDEPVLTKPTAKPVAADTVRATGGAAGFRDQFSVDRKALTASGEGKYWSLKGGRRMVYRSKTGDQTLAITVLRRTVEVDGATCRVVEERLDAGGQIKHITLHYLAGDPKSGDLYCFGKDVDIYKNGAAVVHAGAWRSGVDGARVGLALPGAPRVGMKYFQEVAPGVAMDRGEVTSLTGHQTGKWEVPGAAGDPAPTARTAKWDNCLVVRESSAFEKEVTDKWYVPGVGLIRIGDLELAGVYGE